MARLNQNRVSSGKKILLVDDQDAYLQTVSALLIREGHEVKTARSGEEGLDLLMNSNFDLLLLDYYMPGGMTGEEVVTRLRKFNPYVQVILQTGYSGDYPPREMLKRLDIQGYHDKSEGPDRLLIWVDAGLKAAYTVQMLNQNRQGLRYILNITPDLHKIQPIEDLLQGILLQVSGLLGVVNSFLAVFPESHLKSKNNCCADGFVAMLEGETDLMIRACTGRFSTYSSVTSSLDEENHKIVQDVLKNRKIQVDSNTTIVPLCFGEQVLGVIFIDRPINKQQDIELVQIFANQAAVSIQNTRLYEMATLDPLTGVYVRRFFDQWIVRELRTSMRSQQPLTLFMIDLDKLKVINDNGGHIAGDNALSILGKVLRQATRSNDFVGRYGGDEFAVLLPQTSIENSVIVSNRIFELLKDKTVQIQGKEFPIQVSFGVGCIGISEIKFGERKRLIPQSYFEDMSRELVRVADEVMYQAKRDPDKHLVSAPLLSWKEL
jgi:diguanylate cyclase (GGDEF)-like protein